MARPRTQTVRSLMSEALSETVTKEKLTEIIETALGAETLAVAECPECGKAMKVHIPDFKKQMDMVIAALEQAEGKSAQASPDVTTIVVERPAR